MSLTIEEVTGIAKDFAHQNGYPYTRLESVDLVGDQWVVVLDPMLISIARFTLEITINDATGKAVGFKKKTAQQTPLPV